MTVTGQYSRCRQALQKLPPGQGGRPGMKAPEGRHSHSAGGGAERGYWGAGADCAGILTYRENPWHLSYKNASAFEGGSLPRSKAK